MSIRKPIFALVVGALVSGIAGCSEPPKPKKKGPPKPQTEKSDEGSDPAAGSDATAGEDGVSEPAEDDPLGSRFKDPAWYTPEIIAHDKIIQNGRSEARDDGTFSSALVLQLTADISPEDCVQTLVGKAEPHGLSFADAEKGEDGRLTVRAEDDRMRVTFVCGNAKGVPTAFVGYEWKPGA